MISTLGKRKRRDQIQKLDSDVSTISDQETSRQLQTLLQQHFEATFEPLKGVRQSVHEEAEGEAQAVKIDTESNWTGISEEEDEDPQQIFHYHVSHSSKLEVPKEELKTFMSTRPPSIADLSISKIKSKTPEQIGSVDAATDAENFKKDLALQRLLKESHLLESRSSLSLSGQNRHKALDLRLQDLGSKSSIFTQQKMPLAQRKGIIAKATERNDSRRREAKENGIVLEKAVKGKKKHEAKRQRGVGAPSVGKFQGGMLKLSRKDVAEIVGPKETPKGRGRR